MTVDDAGVIYVSDSSTGAVYRVDAAYEPSLLHRFEPSEAFTPNGLVFHPSGYLLIAGGESPLQGPARGSGARQPGDAAGAGLRGGWRRLDG